MKKCDMSKRNGEVRYVKTKWRSSLIKHDLGQTGLMRLVKQMDKTNRFRSTGSGQHGLGKQAKGELPQISFLDYT